MNQGANVRSIEALGELRSALAIFEEEAAAALSMAEADIVRTIDRIRAHSIPHWKKEILRREELLCGIWRGRPTRADNHSSRRSIRSSVKILGTKSSPWCTKKSTCETENPLRPDGVPT